MAILSQPSDIELAKMLRALVDPSASPPSGNAIAIHDADVYAQDPDDLTQQFPPAVAEDGQKAWYFSTTLSQRGKRKKRCMESGVWHDEGKSKPVVGSQARRNLFVFIKKVHGKKEARTGWSMHEFRVPVPDGNEESMVVLCKVFRSSRWCAPNPAIPATAEAQAEVEVEEDEALVKAVQAREAAVARREAAVKVREEALAAREAAVEATEAWARGHAARLAVWERNLQEWQSNLAAREAVVEAREAALQARLAASEVEGEASERRHAPLESEGIILAPTPTHDPEEFERRLAELEREADGEGLARREVARLAAWEFKLQEREGIVTAREAAFRSRHQELQAELAAELEALVRRNAAIMMAALVARAGLLLAIAGASRAVVAHCGGGVEHWSLCSETLCTCTTKEA